MNHLDSLKPLVVFVCIPCTAVKKKMMKPFIFLFEITMQR